MTPLGSIRPGLANYLKVARADLGHPLHAEVDRFERDLQATPGETLQDLRQAAQSQASAQTQEAGASRRRGWLIGAAAAATWVVVPLVGTLVSAPIFASAYHRFKESREHRQSADEAAWFLQRLEQATPRLP